MNCSCVGLELSFPHKISRQDRLATTIGNSVGPQHPRFWCLRRISLFQSRSLLASDRLQGTLGLLLLRCNVFAAVSSWLSHRERLRSGDRFVNPYLAGKNRWCGSASYEALRVTLKSNIEHILALPQDVFRLTIVNRRRRQQADAGMTVLVVVPRKKTLTESTTVLDAPQAVRNSGRYFMVRNWLSEKGLSSET